MLGGEVSQKAEEKRQRAREDKKKRGRGKSPVQNWGVVQNHTDLLFASMYWHMDGVPSISTVYIKMARQAPFNEGLAQPPGAQRVHHQLLPGLSQQQKPPGPKSCPFLGWPISNHDPSQLNSGQHWRAILVPELAWSHLRLPWACILPSPDSFSSCTAVSFRRALNKPTHQTPS